jgi:hypothetical protein
VAKLAAEKRLEEEQAEKERDLERQRQKEVESQRAREREERARQQQQQLAAEQERQERLKRTVYHEPLKDSGTGQGGLSRSHSSPNIDQVIDIPLIPRVQRRS